MNTPDIQSIIDNLVTEQPFIIVEGAKDKTSLEKLGLKNVLTLKGKPLFKVVEEIAVMTKECMILTDLDIEGKKLYAKLKKDLQRHRVKINDWFRNFLFKETTLRCIEGLHTYVQSIII